VAGRETRHELTDREVVEHLRRVFALEVDDEDVRRALADVPGAAPA
jgi:hypothetical protein